MIEITVETPEKWDSETDEFVYGETYTLELEHSLDAIRRWEAKYHTPFLTEKHTTDEFRYYVRCMTLNKVSKEVYDYLTEENFKMIQEYLDDKATATIVHEHKKKPTRFPQQSKKEIITAEILYYDIAALQLPESCQYWHVNQLLMLIRVSDIKSNPDKHKMTNREALEYQHELNKQRRKAKGGIKK